MEAFVKFRNKYMPDKEIWLSGVWLQHYFQYNLQRSGNFWLYKRRNPSQMACKIIFELAASGIDKAIMYRLSDEEEDYISGNTFCTTGLTYKRSTGYLPKLWFYVYTLKNNLYNSQIF